MKFNFFYKQSFIGSVESTVALFFDLHFSTPTQSYLAWEHGNFTTTNYFETVDLKHCLAPSIFLIAEAVDDEQQ